MSLLRNRLKQIRPHNTRNKNLVDCPNCEGLGEVTDYPIYSHMMEPPMITCPECLGSGQISPEEAKDYEDKSFSDYEEDYETDYWEQKWELENER